MGDFASDSEIQKILTTGTPLLDVRAPIEFKKGALPGAINIPILNDEERAAVGTAYKRSGPEKAVELGETLVSGPTKEERVRNWGQFFKAHPSSVLYCFRGGQRSQYAQRWLRESGWTVLRIEGGYKKWRQWFIDSLTTISAERSLWILGGQTGSGKTELLHQLGNSINQIDLESIANHRGSAFGNSTTPQPTQVDFENRLSLSLYRTQPLPLAVEDESRMIGAVFIPDSLYAKMQLSPVALIEEPIELRAKRIFNEYVLEPVSKLSNSNPSHDDLRTYLPILTGALLRIQKRLGGKRTEEAMALLNNSVFNPNRSLEYKSHEPWIIFLLQHYYDPMYEYGIEKKSGRIAFRGTREEVSQVLRLKCPSN